MPNPLPSFDGGLRFTKKVHYLFLFASSNCLLSVRRKEKRIARRSSVVCFWFGGGRRARELADRMAARRQQAKADDGYVRETFSQPRDQARQTAKVSSIGEARN